MDIMKNTSWLAWLKAVLLAASFGAVCTLGACVYDDDGNGDGEVEIEADDDEVEIDRD